MRALAGLLLSAIIATGLKAGLIWAEVVPFNSDEAVVGLMARHILQGERPVFFYGQAYMGTLDAWIVAGGFSLFGERVWVIRLVQILLYALTLLTTAWVGKKVFNLRVGVIAALLLAIPQVNLTLYTTASLGGYGEALLIGNLILLSGMRIGEKLNKHDSIPAVDFLLLGFLVGLGLWAFGLTLVYSLPVGIYLVWFWFGKDEKSRKRVSAARIAAWCFFVLLGICIGSGPWWGYAIQNGVHGLLSELGGGAIAGVEGLPFIFQLGQHSVNLLLLGSTVIFGLRPPWSVEWLGLPLLPFILILWMLVILITTQRLIHVKEKRSEKFLLLGVIGALCAGFVFTPFGADPSGRYFLPISIIMALFVSDVVANLFAGQGKWGWGIVALFIVYNLWGTLQVAREYPPGLTTQFNAGTQIDTRDFGRLAQFLQTKGETRGYTNYWVAYPLAFQTQEQLIFVPRLPYHLDFRYTERDDRYHPYDIAVEQAVKVAYITTHHPELDEHIRTRLKALEVGWQEEKIGDFQIFYSLNRPVPPGEIGLGQTNP